MIDTPNQSSHNLEDDLTQGLNKSPDTPHKPITFPPFHQQVLQDMHWDAADNFGRIKIVISEGYIHNESPTYGLAHQFIRFRDLVAFSFQHAPLRKSSSCPDVLGETDESHNTDILEFSSIAWPNANMWRQSGSRGTIPQAPIGTRPGSSEDENSHAHSPRHASNNIQGRNRNSVPLRLSPRLPTLHPFDQVHCMKTQDSRRPLMTMSEDPFLEAATFRRDASRRVNVKSSTLDEPMPDAESLSAGPSERIASGMTGVTGVDQRHHASSASLLADDAIDRLLDSLSPEKKQELINTWSPTKIDLSETLPPDNTPALPTVDGVPTAAAASSSQLDDGPEDLIFPVRTPQLDGSTSARSTSMEFNGKDPKLRAPTGLAVSKRADRRPSHAAEREPYASSPSINLNINFTAEKGPIVVSGSEKAFDSADHKAGNKTRSESPTHKASRYSTSQNCLTGSTVTENGSLTGRQVSASMIGDVE